MLASKRTTLFLIFLVFLLGAVSGGVGVYLIQHQRSLAAEPDWRRHPKVEGRMLKSLVKKLELSPEQLQQVKSVLARRREQVLQLQHETQPRYEQIRKSTREDVRGILSPEQRRKFDQGMEEHERKFHSRKKP
ncbi:MAG: hypothetical protein HY652_07720 [Acidobacteria bacterium]|nr:hypothetical protein [Acidobacteriota bacterium]